VAGNTGNWKLVGSVSNNTSTTFSDAIADASLGADAPSTNTTLIGNVNVGSANVMTLLSSGNVGIGTTTPTAKLQVVGSSDIIQTIIKGNSTQIANLQEWQNSGGTALLKVQPDGDLEFVANNIVTDTTTGTKIGTATNQKLGFWNATPAVQQVFATGASHTVDELITVLQNMGLIRQS